MAQKLTAYSGLYTAGNNHYHGVKSIEQHGAIAHANKLAQILIRAGKAATEEEAISLANSEVQRLRWNSEGFQANRLARQELDNEQAELVLLESQTITL